MNQPILFLLLISPTLLFGQKTAKIVDGDESYFVLKENKTIKHGEYKRYGLNNQLLIKGYYNLGVKDSLWQCYDFSGQVTLKYDYNKSEVVLYLPTEAAKARKYRIIINDNLSDTRIDRLPIFLDGDAYILSQIATNIQYPAAAIENRKSGTVLVRFTIDKTGKTSNFNTETLLGFGMDEEAIRVVKLLPQNWLPGLSNGQPVDVEITIPIKFKLN